MPEKVPTIRSSRLRSLLEGINRFGHNPETGGFNRPGYSDADMAVRRWFAEQMAGDGLATRTDAVGNLFGRFGPHTGPCILAGSHLDTVPEGGAFDGALGTAVALESVRALRDAEVAPAVAVEVVATAEEEGRFGGMLGSQAIVGLASREWVEAASDADGKKLADAMRAQGFAADKVAEARRDPSEICAFVELHVEQGPVLEKSAIPIGIVEAVSGVCNLALRFTGMANHSGTTPMDARRDAFAGLAEVAARLPEIISRNGTERSRMTIGKIDIFPNFPHTIPGRAECVVNIRDTDVEAMQEMASALRANAESSAASHGLELKIEQKSWLDPVRLDKGLVELFAERAQALGMKYKIMPSGAGHDAQTMQSICPAALIFVPSRGGISHAPQEWTDWEDIEKGASLYLAALVELIARSGSP